MTQMTKSVPWVGAVSIAIAVFIYVFARVDEETTVAYREDPDAAQGAHADVAAETARVARMVVAVERGETFLAADEIRSPFGLLAIDMLTRRFHSPGFGDALNRFEAIYDGLRGDRAAYGPLLWRRAADRGTSYDPHAMANLPPGLDRLTLPALYCDVVPLDDAWRSQARRALDGDAYEKTHVVYALLMARDIGCAPPLPDDVVERAFAELTALTRTTEPGDVHIESAAFLQNMGEGARIEDTFVDAMLAAQLPDGSWAWEHGESIQGNWHSTVLAVWFLRERSGSEVHDTAITQLESRAPWTSNPGQ